MYLIMNAASLSAICWSGFGIDAIVRMFVCFPTLEADMSNGAQEETSWESGKGTFVGL